MRSGERYKNPTQKCSVEHGKVYGFYFSDGKPLKSFNQECDMI